MRVIDKRMKVRKEEKEETFKLLGHENKNVPRTIENHIVGFLVVTDLLLLSWTSKSSRRTLEWCLEFATTGLYVPTSERVCESFDLVSCALTWVYHHARRLRLITFRKECCDPDNNNNNNNNNNNSVPLSLKEKRVNERLCQRLLAQLSAIVARNSETLQQVEWDKEKGDELLLLLSLVTCRNLVALDADQRKNKVGHLIVTDALREKKWPLLKRFGPRVLPRWTDNDDNFYDPHVFCGVPLLTHLCVILSPTVPETFFTTLSSDMSSLGLKITDDFSGADEQRRASDETEEEEKQQKERWSFLMGVVMKETWRRLRNLQTLVLDIDLLDGEPLFFKEWEIKWMLPALVDLTLRSVEYWPTFVTPVLQRFSGSISADGFVTLLETCPLLNAVQLNGCADALTPEQFTRLCECIRTRKSGSNMVTLEVLDDSLIVDTRILPLIGKHWSVLTSFWWQMVDDHSTRRLTRREVSHIRKFLWYRRTTLECCKLGIVTEEEEEEEEEEVEQPSDVKKKKKKKKKVQEKKIHPSRVPFVMTRLTTFILPSWSSELLELVRLPRLHALSIPPRLYSSIRHVLPYLGFETRLTLHLDAAAAAAASCIFPFVNRNQIITSTPTTTPSSSIIKPAEEEENKASPVRSVVFNGTTRRSLKPLFSWFPRLEQLHLHMDLESVDDSTLCRFTLGQLYVTAAATTALKHVRSLGIHIKSDKSDEMVPLLLDIVSIMSSLREYTGVGEAQVTKRFKKKLAPYFTPL